MKLFSVISILFIGLVTQAFSATNLSDAIDANEVEAERELREKELINQPDVMDKNPTPQAMEERLNKEKWRKDYKEIQGDMKRMNKKKQ